MRRKIIFLLLFHLFCIDSIGSFSTTPDAPLTRFVVDPDSHSVFVAGTNLLVRIDEDSLRVLDRVRTGPKPDSPACHASGCSDEQVEKKLTDNVNKILVLDKDTNELISCGSLFQGACRKFQATDLSRSDFVPRAVAANDNSSSTFAFIGPQRYNRGWGHGNVLYVGATFTHQGDYRADVPAVASRNLHDLELAEFTFSKQSQLKINNKFRDRFLVDYVYGFNTSTHIYFAVVQHKSHIAGHDDKGLTTRLARVCISDGNFDTYNRGHALLRG